MIIRGGENIYPREIEEYLRHMPEISDVQVFGIPDAKYGEAAVAWIILRKNCTLTEDQVKAFCKGTIASFKIPGLRAVRRFLPHDGQRQNPEVQDEGIGSKGNGAGRHRQHSDRHRTPVKKPPRCTCVSQAKPKGKDLLLPL